MKIKAFAVIDTNVLISAMYSDTTPPYTILRLVEEGNIIPIFDKRILKEYYAVFNKEKFSDKFGQEYVEKMLHNTMYIMVKNGIYINDVDKTIKDILDKDDIPFFEVKESSQEFESILVTGNIRHFPQDNYIVTPKELLVIMQQMERFIQKDLDYESTIRQIIKTNVETPKYTSGDLLLNEIFNEDVNNNTEFTLNKSYFEDLDR